MQKGELREHILCGLFFNLPAKPTIAVYNEFIFFDA